MAAQSAGDACMMQLPGVTSEGKVQGHVGWFALTGFDWGGTREGRTIMTRGGNRTTAWTPQLRSMTVQRTADSQSAVIWSHMVRRTTFPSVKIEWLRTGTNGPIAFFTFELLRAQITRMGEDAVGDHPGETIDFRYAEILLGVRNVNNALSGAQDMVVYSVPQHAGG